MSGILTNLVHIRGLMFTGMDRDRGREPGKIMGGLGREDTKPNPSILVNGRNWINTHKVIKRVRDTKIKNVVIYKKQ